MARSSRSTAMTRRAPAASSARVSPPGPGPISTTSTPSSGPAARAMRAVRLRSSRKFWPSDFLARETVPADDLAQRRQVVDGAHARRASGAAYRRAAESRAASRSAAIRLPRIGAAGAGDVEGGAVIGRGAHERQAERDVDRVIERQRLDRDQRLVVIHRERRVVALARRLMEHRVGRQRAARVDALGHEPLDRGPHDRQVLLAERAFLARMRIEAGDGEARMRDAEAVAQIARHDAAGLDDEIGGELRQRRPSAAGGW